SGQNIPCLFAGGSIMGFQPRAAEENVEQAFSWIPGSPDEQVVDHRQRWKQPDMLPRPAQSAADALMEFQPIELSAVERYCSVIRLHDTADQIEQRRLAGSVG